MRTLPVLLAAAVFTAALPARGDEPYAAGARAGASLVRQLAAARPAVGSIAVAPIREASGEGAGALRAFQAALTVELRGAKLPVKDWYALEAATRERLLVATTRGQALPAAPDVGAVVTGEAAAEAGALRVALRVVSTASGAVVATETARLDRSPPPGAAAASPAAGPPAARPAAAAQPREAARAALAPASVDVAVRRAADALVAGFSKLPGGVRYRRLAVLPLAEHGPEARKLELGPIVTAELSTTLRRDHDLLLVERARIASLLSEIKLGEMGLVDAKDAPRLGKFADAQALVMGSVSQAGDRYLLDVRIVSTESAETLATASEPVASATLVALSRDSVVLRSRGDALFRSLVAPGWGQVYNRQPVKAAVLAGAELAVLGGALAFHLKGASAESDYRSKATATALGPDPAAAAVALREDATDAYRWRNRLLWGAAALWALGAVDAYAFGVDGDEVASGGVALLPAEGGLGLAVAGRF